MPRPLRPAVAGGIYHVTVRGNRRQTIFISDGDRRRFLKLLAEVVRRYGWRCHAYCLMDNHFHLALETPVPNISGGMQRLNSGYATWFNRRHALDGHVFQGRFHSRLLETEWHLLELSRYVVLNPVRAGVCRAAGEWPWSSYRGTSGAGAAPRFLSVDMILAQFGRDRARARSAYAQFVREGVLIRAS
jgi:putative transposase